MTQLILPTDLCFSYLKYEKTTILLYTNYEFVITILSNFDLLSITGNGHQQ